MKKILVLALAVCMSLVMFSCGSDKENTEPSINEHKAEEPEAEEDKTLAMADGSSALSLENSEGTIKFIKAERVNDYEKDPGIRVYFEYKNLKSEENYIPTTFMVEAIQNNESCDISAVVHSSKEDKNYSQTIASGESYTASCVFKLLDENSPVTVKVTDITRGNILDDIHDETEISLK